MARQWAAALVALLLGGLGRPAAGQELTEPLPREMQAIYADKAAWTPAQRKLDTSLLYASRESQGRAIVQGLDDGLAMIRRVVSRAGVGADGMVAVDIRAEVTDELLRAIVTLGGRVGSAFPRLDALGARVPIRRIEAIAARPDVRQIRPKKQYLLNAGAQTSEGDVAHGAASARLTYGIDGTGVKVGVLSDGVDGLAARQGTGDLPPSCPRAGACVEVVPGQAGSGSEGTAMLEIVHDLAPGAKLAFATAAGGEAGFAANILALKNDYGCDVVVDDVTYVPEGAFQDGTIARAVNAVKAAGAVYFSAVGGSGRLDAGTSGTWEGDWLDSGHVLPPTGGHPARPMHSFNGLTGAAAAYSDQVTASRGLVVLEWSDPLAASANDYDLFLFDSALTTLLDFSATTQDGTQDPFELLSSARPGDRLVVVLSSGAARALRLATYGGRLSIATAGAVSGHSGGESTVSVTATDVSTAGGGAFTGGAANPIDSDGSDGPRRIFYNPSGTAITPGNVLFATGGGRELQKPDVTAAGCVTTTTPGFTLFCGTSAAAPHAAAIAALLKSAPNRPGGGQVLAAMFATALDVDPPGRDRNAGVGIVMANAAAGALTSIPALAFYTLTPCRAVDTRQPGGATAGAPLACGLEKEFTIGGGTCGVPPRANAVSLNVTVTQPTAAGNVRLFAPGAPAPTVSDLNYAAGQTRANNAVVPLSAAGQVAVKCSPSGTAHVILDVNGYFQ